MGYTYEGRLEIIPKKESTYEKFVEDFENHRKEKEKNNTPRINFFEWGYSEYDLPTFIEMVEDHSGKRGENFKKTYDEAAQNQTELDGYPCDLKGLPDFIEAYAPVIVKHMEYFHIEMQGEDKEDMSMIELKRGKLIYRAATVTYDLKASFKTEFYNTMPKALQELYDRWDEAQELVDEVTNR